MATVARDLSDLLAVFEVEAEDVTDVDSFVRQRTEIAQLASSPPPPRIAATGDGPARRVLWPVLASAAAIVVIAAGSVLGTVARGGHQQHSTTPTVGHRATTTTASSGGGNESGAPATGNQPGSDMVTRLAPTVTVTGSGTQSVNLGQPPAGANRIEIQLTCLTTGTFTFSDGAAVTCGQQDLGTKTAIAGYNLPIHPGQTATRIAAGSGDRWHLSAFYAKVTITAWGVNAHGQTYGVANAHGTPELIEMDPGFWTGW